MNVSVFKRDFWNSLIKSWLFVSQINVLLSTTHLGRQFQMMTVCEWIRKSQDGETWLIWMDVSEPNKFIPPSGVGRHHLNLPYLHKQNSEKRAATFSCVYRQAWISLQTWCNSELWDIMYFLKVPCEANCMQGLSTTKIANIWIKMF